MLGAVSSRAAALGIRALRGVVATRVAANIACIARGVTGVAALFESAAVHVVVNFGHLASGAVGLGIVAVAEATR